MFVGFPSLLFRWVGGGLGSVVNKTPRLENINFGVE